MNFRKTLLGLLILTLFTTSIFAKAKKAEKNSGKIKVVATIFPEYDWAREIIGDTNSAELTLLIGNGVDLHSYQPSIQDIAKISTADIFIYVGGESDGWVKNALKNASNKNMKVINLMETLGDKVKAEEVKEGMQAEEEEEHEHHHHDGDHDDHDHEAEEHHHHHHDDDEDEEEVEYDEHVWLSLRNAKILSAEIASALCEKDAANASAYKANLASYTARLDSLDSKYAAAVKAGSKNTILFGDRFPFRYLVDDYGLDYFAAFVGCSAETEASFETVIFLSKKVDELGLNSVLKIESGDGKIARTIIQNTKKKNAKVLTLDSIQSTTAKQAKAGTTYLKIMEDNLTVLAEALK